MKWDSLRTCGYFFAREHTSAATLTVKMVLERLWRYDGQHSCFFREGGADSVGRVLLGSYSRRTCGSSLAREHASSAKLPVNMGLLKLWRYAGHHFCFSRGGVRSGGSRRTCGYSYAREHTSASIMAFQMSLERLWCYACQQSGFSREDTRSGVLLDQIRAVLWLFLW